MKANILLAAMAAAAVATAAHAAPIAPVSVTASNTFPFWNQYKAENLINGSGLSGGKHDADYNNMWMTDLGVNTATLVFDLGAKYDLSGVEIWNYNFGTPGYLSLLERGVDSFVVSLSTDGVTFGGGFAGELGMGTGQGLEGESFGLSGLGRYVKIELTSNHVTDPSYIPYSPIGLSEVQFSGAAVPEPAAWGLMVLGVGMVGATLRQRQRTIAA